MMYYLNVEKRGQIIAGVATFVLTAVFIVCSMCIKQKPQKVYKTIQIQLAPTSNAPVVEQLSKKEQQKRAQTAKKAQQKAVKEEKKQAQALKKSVEEMAAEQRNAPKTEKIFDDSLFNDAETESTSSSGVTPKPQTQAAKSSLSGSAASNYEKTEASSSTGKFQSECSADSF